MNRKQLAAEAENFPSLLFELSERQSAGVDLFSLKKGGGRSGGCQETAYNPPESTQRRKPAHNKPGIKKKDVAESGAQRGGGELPLPPASISISKYRPSEDLESVGWGGSSTD